MSTPSPQTVLEHRVHSRRLHLQFLDGFRGLAALWVLIAHVSGQYHGSSRSLILPRVAELTRWTQNGRDAVAVFIILSGFCLMLPILRSGANALAGGLTGFYKRRAWRILPPYYAAVALSLGLIVISHHTKGSLGVIDTSNTWAANFSTPAVLTHILLIQNWFSSTAFVICTAMWSVSVEWQIYFVFALALLPLWRHWQGDTNILGNVLLVSAALAIGYLPHFLLSPSRNFDWSAPWYLGLFAMGMVGAVIATSSAAALTRLRQRVHWGGTALALTVITFPVCRGALHLSQTFIDPLLGLTAVALLVWLSIHSMEQNAEREPALRALVYGVLSSRPAVFLGTFSYSLYLTHTLNLHRITTSMQHLHLSPAAYALGLFSCSIVFSLVFAYGFFLFFERPFLQRRKHETMQSLAREAVLSPAP